MFLNKTGILVFKTNKRNHFNTNNLGKTCTGEPYLVISVTSQSKN